MPIPPYLDLTREPRCGRRKVDPGAGPSPCHIPPPLQCAHITALTPHVHTQSPRAAPGPGRVHVELLDGGGRCRCHRLATRRTCTRGPATCSDWARDSGPELSASSVWPQVWRCHTDHGGGGAHVCLGAGSSLCAQVQVPHGHLCRGCAVDLEKGKLQLRCSLGRGGQGGPGREERLGQRCHRSLRTGSKGKWAQLWPFCWERPSLSPRKLGGEES